MMIYLVRRYVDALPHDEYGVDDNYTLIGAFTDPVAVSYTHLTLPTKRIV